MSGDEIRPCCADTWGGQPNCPVCNPKKPAPSKHTPEPWIMDTSRQGCPVVRVPGGQLLQQLVDDATFEANVRRIVACVNACAGLSTEALEAGAIRELQRALALAKDEEAGLRAALEGT